MLDVSVTGLDGLMETVGELLGVHGTSDATQFPEGLYSHCELP